MDTEYGPVINNWYQQEGGQLYFCVIDVDATSGIIDIQHADGDLDTMDIDTWYESSLEMSDEPKTWALTLNSVSEESADGLDDGDKPDEPTTLDSIAAIDEQQPDAIDERVIQQEWETEETVEAG